MTHQSWVALHGMSLSFIELCKPLHHNRAVIHERVKKYKWTQFGVTASTLEIILNLLIYSFSFFPFQNMFMLSTLLIFSLVIFYFFIFPSLFLEVCCLSSYLWSGFLLHPFGLLVLDKEVHISTLDFGVFFLLLPYFSFLSFNLSLLDFIKALAFLWYLFSPSLEAI